MQRTMIPKYLLAGLVLIIWLPAICLFLSLAISSITGCQVNEAFPQPCLIAGIDIGGALAFMFTMGWLVLILLPFMVLTLLGLLGWGAVSLYRAMRRS